MFRAPARISNLPSLSPDPDSESDPFARDDVEMEGDDGDDDEQEIIEIDSQASAGGDAQEEQEERREHIPPDLLTRLLHEHFREEGTRLSKDASTAVGRYMETFVREALARAAFARVEIDNEGGGGDGFLEVEDLEKLAPQLLLDF